MSAGQQSPAPGSIPGLHVATVAHEGFLWDAYLEFDDDPRRPLSYRGRLRFDQAGDGASASTQTTVIIIEESYEEALAKARSFGDRQLQALLRSALPGEEEG